MKKLLFILFGFYFGIALVKSEAISWYRIVEMFQFQSFHLFGVIGSAIVVGIISVQLIKMLAIKSVDGEKINLSPKPLQTKANLVGGILFGLGWSFVGACPAPLYIHIGLGNFIILLPIIFALLGVILYGAIKKYLPH